MDAPLFFWKRAMYLCMFADNVKIAARPNDIDDFDLGILLRSWRSHAS